MIVMTMTQYLHSGEKSFSEDHVPVQSYDTDLNGEAPIERWPILVRILVITGLSLLLWAGIIWTVTRIF
jgi:hypothetical protein